MTNYSKNTQITFYTKENVDSLLENGLFFNGLNSTNRGILVAFLLVGTFTTQKQITFLNDFIARMFLTFEAQHQKDKFIKLFDTKEKELKTLTQSTQLKSLQTIKDFQKKYHSGKGDWLFCALKEWAIQNIRHNKILNYCAFESWALNNFLHTSKKCKSDIVCKTRSIFNYYENRNWEIETTQRIRKTKNNEELKMTRKENCKKMAQDKILKNEKKVKHFLSGMFVEEYKKKNGKWNIQKIAKELNLTRNTIYKVLEQI